MKTEFLKSVLSEAGVPEDKQKDAIDKIFAENGKDVTAVKEKVTTAEKERDDYKDKYETAEKAVKEFEGVDVKDLQGKITKGSPRVRGDYRIIFLKASEPFRSTNNSHCSKASTSSSGKTRS
jgi:hypothetical protein